MKLARLFMLVVASSFAGGVMAMVFGGLGMRSSLWLELACASSFIVAAGALPAAACATALDRGRLRGLMWSGIACAILATAGWVGAYVYASTTWGDIQVAADVLMLPSTWAVICMMTALLFPHRRQRAAVAAVGATAWLSSLATVALVLALVWSRGEMASRAFETGIMVCIILAIFGTMLTMVLQRLPQLSGTADPDQEALRLPMQVWCPRCGRQQGMQTGGANCEACGLAIAVMLP